MNKFAKNEAGTCPLSALSDSFLLTNEQLEAVYDDALSEGQPVYLEDIGHWAVTKHSDIKSILSDKENFSSEIALDPLTPFSDEVARLLKERNFSPRPVLVPNEGDDHARIRRITQLAFSPARFKKLEPYIRQLVNTAVDDIEDDNRADLVAKIFYELPALVLFKLLGVPDKDVQNIKKWADNRLLVIFGKLSEREQLAAVENLVDYWEYCIDLVQEKISRPADDLPSEMLAAVTDDDQSLSVDDVVNVAFGLLLAGHETTTNASANTVLTLLQERSAWEAIVEDPSLIPGAVEECLRFRPSVIAWRRLAKSSVEVSGVQIPEGEPVLCFLAAGNRDESVFHEAKEFDIRRKNARSHVSFGFGRHFCLGGPLARFELKIILEELTSRLPGLRLVRDQRYKPIETVQFRGPKELWVEWD